MKAPFELYVAMRYLRSARSDAFIQLLARITAGGLTLGVAALILALAALSGFQRRLLADVRERTPALEIVADPSVDLVRAREIAEATRGVAGVQELLYGRGWLRRSREVEPVQIVGFERSLPEAFPVRGESSADGAEEAGVWIASTTGYRWGLLPGDVVQLVSPRMTLTPFGRAPTSRRLEILGFHDPGNADERHAQRVALPLDLARTMLETSDRRLEVRLERPGSEREVAGALRAALAAEPSTRTAEPVTWLQANRALRFVLRLEKTVIFLAVVLIVLVASFALIGALSLILASKRAEVGILSAMGASRRSLRRVFLLLGGALAGTGALGGTVLGVGAAWGLDRWGVIKLPGGVFIVDHLPFDVRVFDVAVVLLSTIAVTLVAAAVGARKTGSLDPIEALRR